MSRMMGARAANVPIFLRRQAEKRWAWPLVQVHKKGPKQGSQREEEVEVFEYVVGRMEEETFRVLMEMMG